MSQRPPIRVRGARVHNLRDVSVDVPAGTLSVVSGVSGSGKSSLAFDTLFAEGRRRFLAVASPRARAAVGKLVRPDVDAIEHLPPVLSVAQADPTTGPWTTLGTLTEVHDLLRVLFARAGTPHVPSTGTPLVRHTPRQIVEHVLALPDRTKLMLLAPAGDAGGDAGKDTFDRLLAAGFVRCRVGGEGGEVLDTAECADAPDRHAGPVDAVVDRIIVKEGVRPRVRESVDLAAGSDASGVVIVSVADADRQFRDARFATILADPATGERFRPPDPQTFSFRGRHACPACGGTGLKDPDEDEPRGKHDPPVVCDVCGGGRLDPFAAAVTVAGTTLPELSRLTVSELGRWVAAERNATSQVAREETRDLESRVTTSAAAKMILPKLADRLNRLEQVGLGYLTFDRRAGTLSGGEFRRARLAACVGGGLAGSLFVLDEPTVGLHPADADRLFGVLEALRDAGNTLVVVEHDPDLIRRADHLIDLGPGAGAHGGTVVDHGPPAEVAARGVSPTGGVLGGASESVPDAPQHPGRSAHPPGPEIRLTAVTLHNLKSVDLAIPRGAVTAVTGVSGSGKSSLVSGVFVPAVRAALYPTASAPPAAFDALTGLGEPGEPNPVVRLAAVDQSALGRSPRSTPATVSGVWNEIRRLLARTREARRLGFGTKRFSFNDPAGRCPTCKGRGVLVERMQFLPAAVRPCPACGGGRFEPRTLLVTYAGKTAAQLLALRADEAAELFADVPPVARVLGTFAEVGLGYLTLGQPATTLSGGEAQRVRLASALAETGTAGDSGRTLFVLDEPTAGLHPLDVRRLVDLLHRLADAGHTVVAVEHDLSLIAAADYIVDLGPGAGDSGGTIVCTGPPDVLRAADTPTGRALAGRP